MVGWVEGELPGGFGVVRGLLHAGQLVEGLHRGGQFSPGDGGGVMCAGVTLVICQGEVRCEAPIGEVWDRGAPKGSSLRRTSLQDCILLLPLPLHLSYFY